MSHVIFGFAILGALAVMVVIALAVTSVIQLFEEVEQMRRCIEKLEKELEKGAKR